MNLILYLIISRVLHHDILRIHWHFGVRNYLSCEIVMWYSLADICSMIRYLIKIKTFQFSLNIEFIIVIILTEKMLPRVLMYVTYNQVTFPYDVPRAEDSARSITSGAAKFIMVSWRHAHWSTLVRTTACCLTAQSHTLYQCWLITCEVLWHPPDCNFTGGNNLYPWYEF